MKKNDITNRIFSLEDELDVFSLTVNEIPVWERIRHRIRRSIETDLGIVNQAHDKPNTSKVSNVSKLLKNIFHRNPLLATSADIVFLGHQRRKPLEDGAWWDIYCDPVIDHLESEYVYLERPHLNRHFKPAKTGKVHYLDLLYYSGDIRKHIGNQRVSIDADVREELRGIERRFECEFGCAVGLEKLVEETLISRATTVPIYKFILSRVDPDIAIVVVSYGREDFIEACNQLNIPVIELQHGVIHEHHMGYHYPGKRTKVHFPDYLLTWGEFWSESADFPIPDERVLSVGYPYLEQRRVKYTDIDQKNQILFISQGTIGERLSKFAINVNQHPDIDYDVVYKLHPGEYDRWREAYPWLEDAPLEVVDESGTPLYRLFAESTAQVGVGSTAVYEGLCFDLETYVLELSGSHVLSPLVNSGIATSVSRVDDLVRTLGSSSSGDAEGLKVFESNAVEKTLQALERISAAH